MPRNPHNMQKRLAASILDCGIQRIWLDPQEMSHISMANSRHNVRKMIKEGLIIKRPENSPSRYRIRKRLEAKRKGRHTGTGKRRGTREARMSSKTLWTRRIRVLRRFLKRYRDSGKIDVHLYHSLKLKAKGNEFKNKRVLLEHVIKAKSENLKRKLVNAQNEALRQKNAALKAKRVKKAALQDGFVQAKAAAKPEATKKPQTAEKTQATKAKKGGK
ncbi:putative 60S ribosomal protein L19 [Blattamonas nauphoetae]|uniref:Ribosomal protein L19 n=1 Tax=Blattamonas nauphoetae TaxID=2049346 RepID=A0ABQ9Y9L8_9EUKA|nr:putative 60S ribosomal protein L19 [Blattamonas nauphoetae]